MIRPLFLFAVVFATVVFTASCEKEAEPEDIPSEHAALGDIPCGLSNFPSGVLAFYPFTSGSLNDFSGNGRHLTNATTARPTTDRIGNTNCAYEFEETADEWLTTSGTSFLDGLSEFSISIWYQPIDSSRKGWRQEVLICRGEGFSCPDKAGQWSITLYDLRRAVYAREFCVWDKLLVPMGDNEVAARTGKWHHAVATYNQAANEIRLYRNGVLQESEKDIWTCGITYQDLGDLFIGKRYTGKIDDIALFNKTLSQSDINKLYNMEPCCME